MNALVDDGNNSTSPNSNKRPKDEISDQLLHVPTGHRYLIIYPNLEAMRKVEHRHIHHST